MISELRMRLFSPGKNFIDVGNRKWASQVRGLLL
jgi:hypothetical protein